MKKISKYTYLVQNDVGDLLLYNTYTGVNSFCKVSDESLKTKILNGDLNELSDSVLLALEKHGIIVGAEIDENQKLFVQFANKIKTAELCLTINVTEQCNFRCKYCYESHSVGSMSKDVQAQVIQFVRENIHKYASLHIGWFGGEPLLAKQVIYKLSDEFMKICAFNKRKYSASITTNGFLLDSDTFSELMKRQVTYYQITLDGYKTVHDKYRVRLDGSGTYSSIMRNLHAIKANKRRDFLINLRSNLTQESFATFDDYLNDVEQLCDSDNRFYMSVFKVGNWLGNVHPEIKCDLFEQEDGLRRIYQKILESNKKINLSTLFLNPGSGACYAGKLNKYLIRANGVVHQCTVMFENDNNSIGKIENGKLVLNNKHDAMIINPVSCPKYFECKSAPICMGRPCPINKDTAHCVTYGRYLDVILKIFDKMEWFEKVENNVEERIHG